MADPLEWLFQITDKMSGPAERIANALGKTENSLKHAEHATTSFEKAAEKAEEQSKDLLKELLKFGGIGLGIEAIAGLFEKVGEMASEAVHKVFELGEETIKAAAKAQRSEASFKLLLGDEGGKEALEYIEKIRANTELTGAELRQVAQSLIASGFKAEDFGKVLPAALDVGAIKGGGIANIQEAAAMLGRINLSGKVEGRSLRALGLSEDDVLSRIAVLTGKAKDEIKKGMQTGDIKPDDVLHGVYEAIAAKEKGVLGTAGVEASKSVEAQLHHLTTLPEEYMERLSKSEGFAKFGGFLENLLKALDPDSPFGQEVLKRITDIFDQIMGVFGGPDQGDMFEGIKGGILGILDIIKDFVPTIKGAIEWVAGLIKDLRALSLVWDGIKLQQEEVSAGASFFTSGGKNFDEMAKVAVHRAEHEAKIREFYGIGKDMSEGVAKGIGDGTKLMADVGANSVLAVEDRIRDTTQTHSPSLLFAKIGRGFAEGIAMGIEEGADAIDRASSSSLIPGVRGRGGGQQISIGDIIVNVDGAGSADEVGAAAAHKLAMAIASHLEGAFEQLATEQGVDQ
jgi:tape measure domain-containing protein